MIYNSERYILRNSQIKVEALIHNAVHKDTGKYVFPFHSHSDFLEISMIFDGEETVEIDSGVYLAKKGDIIIKNAGALHQESAAEGSKLEEITIGLSGIDLDGLPENALIRQGVCPVIPSNEYSGVLRELFLNALRLYEKSVSMYSEVIKLNIRNFLATVLIIIDEYGENGSPRERLSALVYDVLVYIDKNYHKQISLDDIAKIFYVSPYYLARQFKKEIGYSVNQYIQNRRLGEAERRLVFEDTPVKEIAADCGYANLKYFYSVFKTKTGHTPVEFRTLLQLYKRNERDPEFR
jgi:AraC-like DNA-binding protein